MRARRIAVVTLCASGAACSLVFSDYDQRFGTGDATVDAPADVSVTDAASDAAPDVIRPCDAAIPNVEDAGPLAIACPDDTLACVNIGVVMPDASTNNPCCLAEGDGGEAVFVGCAAGHGGSCAGIVLPWSCDGHFDCPFSAACCVNAGAFTPIDFSTCPATAHLHPLPIALPECDSVGPTRRCVSGDYTLCTNQSECGPPDDAGPYRCQPVALDAKTFGVCVQ